MNNESDLPDYLRETVDAMKFHRFTGEWDLDIPAALLYENFSTSKDWVAKLINQFLSVFSWVDIQKLDLGLEGESEKPSWTDEEGSLQTWLDSQAKQEKGCYGLESTLDLSLYWIRQDGTMGRSILQGAGELLVDKSSASTLTCTLTIWPNFFTDEIYVYQKKSEYLIDKRLTSFQPAALENRLLLTNSLREWEFQTGGTISSWESELVEGADRYGFADDAYPSRT